MNEENTIDSQSLPAHDFQLNPIEFITEQQR